MNAADFTLDSLYAGTWCIRYNIKQFFDFKKQSNKEYVDELRAILGLTDTGYNLPFNYYINSLNTISEEDPIVILYDELYTIESLVSSSRKKKLHEVLIHFLNTQQYYNNRRMDAQDVYNTFIFTNDIFNQKVSGYFTGFAVLYKRKNNKWQEIWRRYILDTGIDLHDSSYGLYRLDMYSEDMNLLKRYYYHVPKHEDIQSIFDPFRNQQIEEKERIDQLLEDTVYAPELSEEEKQIYTRQLLYAPNNLYFTEPVVKEDDYSRLFIDVNLEGIKAMKQPMYIVAEEADTLCRIDNFSLKRRFEITDTPVVIDTKDSFFNEGEPYYFYIEDDKHLKYSFISAYQIPLEDTDDYRKRSLTRFLTNRIQRIMTQLNYDLKTDIATSVAEFMDSATHDSDTTLYNLIDETFFRYIQDKYTTNRFDVLRSLYMNKVYHEDVDFTALSNVKVRPQWHLVDFPYELPDNYIVECTMFTNTGYKKTYYRNTDTAVSIYYRPADYAIFSVFSLDTGKRIGGFLILDNTKPKLRFSSYQLKATIDYE